MSRSAVVVALLVCARGVSAQPVAPDESAETRIGPAQPDEDARHPAAHWLSGRLDGITAKLVVRYHLAALGPNGFNHFELELPDNGVVIGAVVSVEGGAHRLAFTALEQGKAEFEAVLAKPAGRRRRWEVAVSSRYSTSAEVDVAAPHAAPLTIDLEVEAPTCFSHGLRYASVDPAWRPSLDRTLHSQTAVPEGCLARPNDAGGHGMPKAWIAFASDDGSWRPAGEQRIVMRGERVDVAHGQFARVELDVANVLTEVPADLHTVFVIDASVSLTDTERQTQAAVIQSYARHAPGSQIQIVAFARKAHALLPGWTRASAAKLTGLATLPAANGSNVDTGLVEAARWLAHANGTRRIVLFGDERLGKRVAALSGDVLRGLVPERTLVHVVAVDESLQLHAETQQGRTGGGELPADAIVRDDAIAFADLAKGTEGLAARATLIDDRVDATKLVRPIALEHVSVHAAGWGHIQIEGDERPCTGDLPQGNSCAWFGADDLANKGAPPTVSPTIAIEGLLWNHHVHRTITPDAGQRERLARMLTGFMANLGDAEHDLQVVAHAVNDAWQLYGEWGGDDGYADEIDDEVNATSCGCDDSMAGTIGMTSGPRPRMTGPSIAAQLDRAVAGCHLDARVEISVELTLQEIVDVSVTAPRPELRDCVTEAVWNTLLFVAEPLPHAVETIDLGT